MPWFKVDDGLHSHPKALEAGLEAMGLWVLMGSYCGFYVGQGGRVTRAAALRVAGSRRVLERCAARLVAAHLWIPIEDGWEFHEWSAYQPTEADVEAKRQKKREAGRLGGLARAAASAKQTASKELAPAKTIAQPPSRPDPDPKKEEDPPYPQSAAESGVGLRRFSMGTSAEEALEVYRESASEALGRPVMLPGSPAVRRVLCDAINTFAAPTSLSAGIAWLRSAVRAWVREVSATPERIRYTNGWAPSQFAAWLNERGGYADPPATRQAAKPAGLMLDSEPASEQELRELYAELEGTTPVAVHAPRALAVASESLSPAQLADLEEKRLKAIADLRARAAVADSQRVAGSSNAFRASDAPSDPPKAASASAGRLAAAAGERP